MGQCSSIWFPRVLRPVPELLHQWSKSSSGPWSCYSGRGLPTEKLILAWHHCKDDHLWAEDSPNAIGELWNYRPSVKSILDKIVHLMSLKLSRFLFLWGLFRAAFHREALRRRKSIQKYWPPMECSFDIAVVVLFCFFLVSFSILLFGHYCDSLDQDWSGWQCHLVPRDFSGLSLYKHTPGILTYLALTQG